MSKSIDILVKADDSVEEFAKKLSAVLGKAFFKASTVDWQLFSLNDLGIVLNVFEADFDDDCGIELSKYNLIVSCTPDRKISASRRDDWAKFYALVLAEILHKDFGVNSIVVDDMQYLLESFE